jgi:hypothetical protein
VLTHEGRMAAYFSVSRCIRPPNAVVAYKISLYGSRGDAQAPLDRSCISTKRRRRMKTSGRIRQLLAGEVGVCPLEGGALTGSWPAERRRELGRSLLELPDAVRIVPMRLLAYRMAEIADANRVSTLGAEAAAAAEHLHAPLCVWGGDHGPAIRAAVTSIGAEYQVITR